MYNLFSHKYIYYEIDEIKYRVNKLMEIGSQI